MDFRVTVRDHRAGGGGVNTDNVVVNVVNTGAAFLVTSQNSAATLAGGSSQTITWNVAGTTGSGINASNVNIRLSTHGCNTFPTLLASNVANDGSEAVTIPNSATTQGRIKVEPTNNIFFDINNANLTITVPPTPTASPSTPDLLSDTGVSTTDDITSRETGLTARTLQFSVPGTLAGATVTLYAGGVAIGSATGVAGTTTVTTNGLVDLADGTRWITARQTESGKSQSADSPGLSITVDTVMPTPDVVDVAPDRATGVDSINVAFSERVYSFVAGDLQLTRTTDPTGSNLLTAGQTLTTANNVTFTLNNLTSLTSKSGGYSLALSPMVGKVITDAAGNGLALLATDAWVHSLPTWLTATASGATWDSFTKELTVVGPATISADPGAHAPAITANGAGAVLTIDPSPLGRCTSGG